MCGGRWLGLRGCCRYCVTLKTDCQCGRRGGRIFFREIPSWSSKFAVLISALMQMVQIPEFQVISLFLCQVIGSFKQMMHLPFSQCLQLFFFLFDQAYLMNDAFK